MDVNFSFRFGLFYFKRNILSISDWERFLLIECIYKRFVSVFRGGRKSPSISAYNIFIIFNIIKNKSK
jgi:hypothetical protein